MTRPLPPNISASIDHFKKVHHVKQCFPFQQLKTKVYLRTFNDYKCIDFKLFAISLGRWTVEHSCERLKNKQKHNVNLFRVWISTHFLSVKMPEKTDKSLSVFFFFWLPFEIAGGLTIPQMNSTFHVKMIYSRQICYTAWPSLFHGKIACIQKLKVILETRESSCPVFHFQQYQTQNYWGSVPLKTI